MPLGNFGFLFLKKLYMLENLRILITYQIIYFVMLKLFCYNPSFDNFQLAIFTLFS